MTTYIRIFQGWVCFGSGRGQSSATTLTAADPGQPWNGVTLLPESETAGMDTLTGGGCNIKSLNITRNVITFDHYYLLV